MPAGTKSLCSEPLHAAKASAHSAITSPAMRIMSIVVAFNVMFSNILLKLELSLTPEGLDVGQYRRHLVFGQLVAEAGHATVRS